MKRAALFWKNGKHGSRDHTAYRLGTLLQEMKEQFQLDAYKDGEKILIVGTRNLDKGLCETSEAELTALAPGLVICTLLSRDCAVYCSGFLERSPDGKRYEVTTFASLNGEGIVGRTSIRVGPGKVDNKTAAAVFDWGFSPDQGSCIGISAGHWEITHIWLDKWLVQAKPSEFMRDFY
jgi:hypothetical protein